MFQEAIEDLCQRSTQYLNKWVSSCWLAMRRGKWKEAIQPHKKKKGNKIKVQATDREGGKNRGVHRKVAPYSSSHTRWIDTAFPKGDTGKTEDNRV